MGAGEEQIRELALRVLLAKDGDDDAAVAELEGAVAKYLEEQSDKLLLADLKKLERGADRTSENDPAA